MTRDLALDLAPNGGIGIRLTFTDDAGRKILSRPLPTLDPDQLDALRRGQAQEATAGLLAEATSAWLLDKDLSKRLTKALDGQDEFRVVVTMDRDLGPLLGDLPVELVSLPKALLPLVLHPKVSSLVHVPPAIGAAATPAVRSWPLRVLIARSNPIDLGGAVPEAGPIRKEILDGAAAAGLPDGAVQVELLSSEEQGAEPATWSRMHQVLSSATFDVFVYLGHGDLQVIPGTAPVGYLQFEAENGHEAIDARRIAAEFAQFPVPVVILAGCLTAAAPSQDPEEAERQALLEKNLPRYLRGAQGVAQAIIDSEAPVQLAIGMRDLLEVKAATTMLGAFFRNLLKDHPGDVERAIRQTRSDLFNTGRYPPSWSSAVVFAKGAPPTFEFLKDKPAPFSVEKQAQFDVLRQFRQSMAKLFLEAVADRSPFLAALAFAGDQDKALLKKDAMVRPRFVKSASGSTDIVIELVGSITARRLTGNVAIGGDNATDRPAGARPAPRDRRIPVPVRCPGGRGALLDRESGRRRSEAARRAPVHCQGDDRQRCTGRPRSRRDAGNERSEGDRVVGHGRAGRRVVSSASEFVRAHPGLRRAMAELPAFAEVRERAALEVDDEPLYIVGGDTLGDEEELFVETLARGVHSDDPNDPNRVVYLGLDDELQDVVRQRISG